VTEEAAAGITTTTTHTPTPTSTQTPTPTTTALDTTISETNVPTTTVSDTTVSETTVFATTTVSDTTVSETAVFATTTVLDTTVSETAVFATTTALDTTVSETAVFATTTASDAPTKTESVSRLELAACVIGTILGLTVAHALDLDKSTITFWTDSANCLYWINSPSSNLKTFVSNRVGEVHTHSNPSQWKHIPTDINPADIPTRLPKISDLVNNSLWWNGPRFWSDSMSSWPKPFVPPVEVDDEAKNEFKKLFIGNIDIAQLSLLDPCRYSVGKVWNGFDQLISLASEILKQANPRRDFPRANKLALRFLIRRSQANSLDLQEIMHQLRTKKQISKP
jgi:hypothetical protein